MSSTLSAYEEYYTLTMYEDKDSTPLKMLFKHLNLIDLEYVFAVSSSQLPLEITTQHERVDSFKAFGYIPCAC